MQRFWSNFAITLGKRAAYVALATAVVTVLLGFGATKLEFATGQDSYLNDDEQIAIDNRGYQDLFGGQAMLTLFTARDGNTVVDLFSESNLAQLEEVEESLRGSGRFESVVSPLTALQFTAALVTSPDGNPVNSPAGAILLGARERDPDPESQALRLEDSLRTLERLTAVPEADRVFDNRAWVEFLLFDNRGDIRKSLRPFFPDESHAQMVVRLPGNVDIETEGAASEIVVDAMAGRDFEGFDTVTTGAAVLLKDINDYLKGGFLVLGGIAVGIMVVILLVLFNVRWRLLSLLVVLIGVIWAFGLAGYLGIPLSVVTISGLPVLLGVGIDFAIQMHARVEEEVVIDKADHPIQRTLRNLAPALIVATVAAVVAFTALQFSQVPMIREFGILLAVGIAVICVASIILPTAALGGREFRSRTQGRDFRSGALGRLTVWLGSLPRVAVVPLLIASVLVFAGGALVEDSLELQTDPEEWVDQDSQVITDLDAVRREVRSSSELGVLVQADDVFEDEVIAYVDEVAKGNLEQYPDDLLTASSIVTTVSFLMEIPGTTNLAPTGANVRAAYDVAPPDIQRATASENATALNLIFRTGPSSLEERAVYVNEIREALDTGERPAEVRATPSGLAVVGVGLLENLEANRVLLTYVALAGVLVWLAIRLRSPIRALLATVPVLIAVGAASLVAKVSGFELSPLTAVGGPLVIALCTEFTSLILLRFIEERRAGLGPREAVDVAAARTGRAFIVSACTATAGVAVLALSSLPLLRDFGIITGLNVAVALLSALVVLPPLLAWADERGWVSGMRSTAAPH